MVLVALALVAATIGLVRADDAPAHHFGTLQTDPGRARTETARGVDVAHLPIAWDRWEPQAEDRLDRGYVRQVREDVRTFRQAGLRVELGLGVNHPPDWLGEQHPATAYVNQYGDRWTETPNIVFSASVRAEVEDFVRSVDREIGLDRAWSVRVGVGESGELSYPPTLPGHGETNHFWAYDRYAQAPGAGAEGRAATVPPNPMPGWRPGEASHRGAPVTEADVRRWYDWYLSALADTVDWQVDTYTAAGFDGRIKILVPGRGYFPGDLAEGVRHRLAGERPTSLLGRGVGFFETVPRIEHRDNVVIVSTAVVDGTGRPGNNVCRPEDAGVDLHAVERNQASDWSSVRWVKQIAEREGFPVSGESAGPQVAPYYPGVMADAAQQVAGCGLDGLMWAFDRNLYDGTPGSSLQDYAATIARFE